MKTKRLRTRLVDLLIFTVMVGTFPAACTYDTLRAKTPAEQAKIDADKAEQNEILAQDAAFYRSQVVRVCADSSLVQKDDMTGRMFWVWKSGFGDRHEAISSSVPLEQVCGTKL